MTPEKHPLGYTIYSTGKPFHFHEGGLPGNFTLLGRPARCAAKKISIATNGLGVGGVTGADVFKKSGILEMRGFAFAGRGNRSVFFWGRVGHEKGVSVFWGWRKLRGSFLIGGFCSFEEW